MSARLLFVAIIVNIALVTAQTWEFNVYGPHSVVNGVTVECRQIMMQKSLEVQFAGQGSVCPRGAYGAAIVNHSNTDSGNPVDSLGNNCGKIIGTNSGLRETTHDPTEHSEINAIHRLAALFPSEAQVKSYWGALSMYTVGESCPMDAAAEVWSGFKEVIYAVSIEDLTDAGFGQIEVGSKKIYTNSNLVAGAPQVLIKNVLRMQMLPYFAWQFNADEACPTGCHRGNDTSGNPYCFDDVPPS